MHHSHCDRNGADSRSQCLNGANGGCAGFTDPERNQDEGEVDQIETNEKQAIYSVGRLFIWKTLPQKRFAIVKERATDAEGERRAKREVQHMVEYGHDVLAFVRLRWLQGYGQFRRGGY